MVNMAKNNLVTFNPLLTDILPLANENVPPTKSNMILKIDHPFVDLRL